MADVARILAGLGLVTILLATLKRNAERRCWRRFKQGAEDWLDRLAEMERRHPRQLEEDEWKAECERILNDAKFSPLEINQVLELSVVVAKGIAAEKFFV
ncbi:MAG: hypothetical protein MI757_20035 [Pirellulales bacterium]|nr:hypothetical protein [Pirellulales bacterium]